MKTLANIEEPPCEYGLEGKGSSGHLDPVIHAICKSMPVEKIFHVGTYVANPEILGLEYDLLVLVGAGEKRPLCECESLIENRCHDFTMVTASVYKITSINELLKSGNMFFHLLCLSGNTIFDVGNIKMAISQIQDKNVFHENMVKEFGPMIAKARSFFSGACAYRDSGDHQLSSFMLHQVFEQALNSFLTPMMGFRLQTHNLNKLFLNIRRFSMRFCSVFPRNSDSEISLYRVLHKAYIYGRYKNNFEIPEEKVDILIERAAAILDMTTAIFYEKADQLFSGDLNNY